MAELASAAPTAGGVRYYAGPKMIAPPLTLTTSIPDAVVFLGALFLLPRMA